MQEPLINLRPAFERAGRFIIHSLVMSTKARELGPIILLHGLGASAHTYVPLMRALARQSVRLMAPDMPAHGLSPAMGQSLQALEAYVALANVLRRNCSAQNPAIVVGNSLGGAFAINFALDFPELVRGLFLISPAGAPFSGPISNTLARFRPQSVMDSREILNEVMGKNVLNSPLAPVLTLMLKQRALQLLIDSISNESCFSPEDLARLHCPVYMLWGQNDKILPPDQFNFYRRHLSASTVFDRPEHWGHCPQFQYPGDVAKKILHFGRTLA